jgi:hypothetical protein
VKTRLVPLLALIPATAIAHPGHGHTDPDSWAHYLTEPAHVAVLLGAAAVIAIGVVWRRSRRRSRGLTARSG